MLPARIRTTAGWGDACILNVSSRGLMIHSNRPAPKDGHVELRHAGHVIVARVMWRNGARLGLAAEDRLPVEDIVTLGGSAGFQVSAADRPPLERRIERVNSESRHRSRGMQFVGLALIGAALSLTAAGLMAQAFAHPMERVAAALD
jgi:hypothetical protein